MSLIHPTTQKLLTNAAETRVQTILLVGPVGSDKLNYALQLAADLLAIPRDTVMNHPQLNIVQSQVGAISIEQVRELQKNLSLTTVGNEPIRRVSIVYQAGRMKHEAQNALLKTLEEPPQDSALILTAESQKQLLSTVVSRTQIIPVLPIDKQAATNYLAELDIDIQEAERIFAISQGAAGLLKALAMQSGEHELTQSITRAKLWLASEPFQRLVMGKDIADIDLPNFVGALLRVYASGLHLAATKQADTAVINKWSQGCQLLLTISNQLNFNPNKRLMVTRLAVEL